jgi:hypothetical protein
MIGKFRHLHPVPSRAVQAEGHNRVQQRIEEAAARFRQLMEEKLASGLPTSPEELLDLEREIHVMVAKECVDPVVGEIIQAAHDSDSVGDTASQLIDARPYLRLQDAHETVAVTLLGGSIVRIRSPYYLERPPKRGRRRGKGRRGKQGNGLYPRLAVLGIHFRISPALASEVARLTVMSTAQEAVETLQLRGIKVDRKKLLALTGRLAQRGLDHRKWLQEQAEKGVRGPGSLAGKRLAIGTDGGRLRLREVNRQGRRRKSGRRGFDAEWREPKVLIVYEIDDRGRKVKRGGVLRYDATLHDASGTFAILVAMLLEMGAQDALEWIIVGDGAAWIWNRIENLVQSVGYDQAKVTEVVDWYHAVEHLHEVAELLTGLSVKQRRAWVKHMKDLLFEGDIDGIAAEIESRCRGRKAKAIRKGITYFVTHQQRMQYKAFEARFIPLGSGAVESCVRRVVNLRMKGNGIFWEPSNAEDMLHLRAQLLCGRWQSYVATILQPREFWTLNPRVAPSARTLRESDTEMRAAA